MSAASPVLVVFDMDGTLLDSFAMIEAAIHRACVITGVPVPQAQNVRAIIGLSLEEALAVLFPNAGGAALSALTLHYKAAFGALRAEGALDEPLFPGTRACLDDLGAAGAVLGVATGKSRRGLAAVLARHGLHEAFHTLNTADDGPGKPHPAMLLAAMRDTGAVPERVVMVGDTSYDMAMARAAGCLALGVAWGNHAEDVLWNSGAHAVVQRMDEVAPWINATLPAF